MKSSSLLYLSLWSLGLVSVASQKMRGSNGTPRKTRRLQNRTTFESYFQIEYLANGSGDIDFTLVGQALAIAYNNLLEPRFSNEEDAEEYSLYDDPFNRRMERVEVLRVDGLRRLGEGEESRDLQSSSLRNLNVYLRATGSCRGCSSRSKFTNQVSGRRLAKARKLSKRKLQDTKGGGKGGSTTSSKKSPPPVSPPISPPPVPPPTSTPPPTIAAQTPPPTLTPLPPVAPPTSTPPPTIDAQTPPPTPTPLPPVAPPTSTPPPTINSQTPPPTLSPTSGAATAPPVPAPTPFPTAAATTPPPFDDPSTLPTEEELRVAYAIEIHRWEFDIVDVTSLDEVDGPSQADRGWILVYCTKNANNTYDCPNDKN